MRLSLILTGCVPSAFELYSWTIFFGISFLGWLAAPLTHLLFCLWLVVRGTPILAGGIGVARVVVGAVFSVFRF